MKATDHGGTNQTAVWYFIGATFIFTLPNTLFDGLSGWPRIVFMALGIVIMIAGFVQLRREFTDRRRSGQGDDASTPPDA